MKLTLRNYRHGDFEALYRIDRACYASDMAYSREDLRTYLGFVGGECIVAEVVEATTTLQGDERVGQRAKRIAGFCISARRGAHGHIITMDVLKEFRRVGVGSALLAEVEKRLAGVGVRRVGLETATDNEPGIAFWQRSGFTSVGVKKGYYGGRRDAYYMTKAIGQSNEGIGREADAGSPDAELPERRRHANRKRKARVGPS
jgi:[ribosomal protein S18]-alanine N-acetyltransferase